jgi:hypothetical protein
MARWNSLDGGTTISRLLTAATARSAVASGSYLDTQNTEGNMLALVTASGATNETYAVTVGWLSGTSATGVAYTAATSGYTLTLTGKGMHHDSVAIPTTELTKRFLKPRISAITGEHVVSVTLLSRKKTV